MTLGTEDIAPAATAGRRQSWRWVTALLLAPSAVWFYVLLILPLAVVLATVHLPVSACNQPMRAIRCPHRAWDRGIDSLEPTTRCAAWAAWLAN